MSISRYVSRCIQNLKQIKLQSGISLSFILSFIGIDAIKIITKHRWSAYLCGAPEMTPGVCDSIFKCSKLCKHHLPYKVTEDYCVLKSSWSAFFSKLRLIVYTLQFFPNIHDSILCILNCLAYFSLIIIFVDYYLLPLFPIL